MQAIRPCFSTFVNFSPLNLVNIYSASLQYERHPPRSGSDLTKIDRGDVVDNVPLCLFMENILSLCLVQSVTGHPYHYGPATSLRRVRNCTEAQSSGWTLPSLRYPVGSFLAIFCPSPSNALAQFPEAGLPSSQARRSMGRFQRLRSNHACPSPQSSIRRAIRISSIRA